MKESRKVRQVSRLDQPAPVTVTRSALSARDSSTGWRSPWPLLAFSHRFSCGKPHCQRPLCSVGVLQIKYIGYTALALTAGQLTLVDAFHHQMLEQRGFGNAGR